MNYTYINSSNGTSSHPRGLEPQYLKYLNSSMLEYKHFPMIQFET